MALRQILPNFFKPQNLQSLGSASHRHASTSTDQTTAAELEDVIFIDPRTALDRARWRDVSECLREELDGSHGLFTRLLIPKTLAKDLPNAQHELADGDEPLNSWSMGQADELFRYRLVGEHGVKSGFSSALTRALLESISNGKVSGLPSWMEVENRIRSSKGLRLPSLTVPFLFLGRLIESDVASVYALGDKSLNSNAKVKGQWSGILVTASSAAEEWDAGERRPKFK